MSDDTLPPANMTLSSVVKQTLSDFCVGFVKQPYLAYTEHGIHAQYYRSLCDAIPESEQILDFEDRNLCAVQKEYPTAGDLGKSKRQHWDIAVIRKPPTPIPGNRYAYDSLELDCVVEFGMNEAEDHLREDIRRLTHRDARVEHKFICHLYRLSGVQNGRLISGRDWSPRSARILTEKDVLSILGDADVELYYGMHDATRNDGSGAWRLHKGDVSRLG